MKTTLSKWLQKRRNLPLVLIAGIAIAAMLVLKKQPPSHQPRQDLATPVAMLEIQQQSLRPMITSYGAVSPDILLSAKAEVGGRINYLHPELRKGAMLPKNTVVIRIDDKDHLLALSQAKADLKSSEASLKEFQLNFKDARIDLKLAKQKLELAERELKRLAKLLKQKTISQTSLDSQQSAVLQQKQEVQSLNNRLETLPAQQEIAEAKRAIAQAQVETQQRNLDRTEIRLPFNARINQLDIEKDQFVAQGNTLFSAQNTDKVLINAQFSPAQFKIIARSFAPFQEEMRQAFADQQLSDLFDRIGLRATVQLTDIPSAIWQGRVERISNDLDPATRTLGVTISIDKPYENVEPGVKPPLLTGMYTRVNLFGNAEPFYLTPRSALHEGQLYFIDAQNKLERRPLQPYHQQGELALFNQGLSSGERLVVSDLYPAVPGMLLDPKPDSKLEQKLHDWTAEMAQ